MNDTPSRSVFVPFVLLTTSLLLILGWQIFFSLQTRSKIRAQFEQRKQLVEKLTKIQADLDNMLNDLSKLAETDKDAKAVVDKYQIRRNNPPTIRPQ